MHRVADHGDRRHPDSEIRARRPGRRNPEIGQTRGATLADSRRDIDDSAAWTKAGSERSDRPIAMRHSAEERPPLVRSRPDHSERRHLAIRRGP